MTTPAIYLRCSSGFGNKVFDLISAIYLKNKYQTDVYFATNRSIHEKSDDPFFGNIFYLSYRKIKYIYMKKYYELKEKLPIEEQWIDDLSKLPKTITTNIRFGGLYKFAYAMYSTFGDDDKKLFTINPKLLHNEIIDPYVKKLHGNYACIHIRYGDKLCYGLAEFQQTKYTPYMLPIYTPQYYLDQINELLKKDDVKKILIMTDSVDLVRKYITDKYNDNPKVELLDSHYLDCFYLMIKTKYLIMSYSTFSFAAGYFNTDAVCYLVKKYYQDPKKDYIYEDDALSPNWIIIDNKDYVLNFNQDLLKKMVTDYGQCQKYIRDLSNQKGGSVPIWYTDLNEIKNQNVDEIIHNGPITLKNVFVRSRLTIYGTVNYKKLVSSGVSKFYGTVYGTKGEFHRVEINGQLNISKTKIFHLLLNGRLYCDNVHIDNAIIYGTVYINYGRIIYAELIGEKMRFENCLMNVVIIYNNDNKPKKIRLVNSIVDKISVFGYPLQVWVDYRSQIYQITNGIVTVDPEL